MRLEEADCDWHTQGMGGAVQSRPVERQDAGAAVPGWWCFALPRTAERSFGVHGLATAPGSSGGRTGRGKSKAGRQQRSQAMAATPNSTNTFSDSALFSILARTRRIGRRLAQHPRTAPTLTPVTLPSTSCGPYDEPTSLTTLSRHTSHRDPTHPPCRASHPHSFGSTHSHPHSQLAQIHLSCLVQSTVLQQTHSLE